MSRINKISKLISAQSKNMESFIEYLWSLLKSDIPKIFSIAEPIVQSVLEDTTIPANQKLAVIQTKVVAAVEAQAMPVVMHNINTAIVSAIGHQQVDIITPAIQVGGNTTGQGPAALHAHGG